MRTAGDTGAKHRTTEPDSATPVKGMTALKRPAYDIF